MDPLLQRRTPPSGAGRPDTPGRVARGRHRRPGRQRCGHNASLGRRGSVAHMPTATTTTTAADDLRRVIKEVGADPASNQERPSGGPPLGVHFTSPPRRRCKCSSLPTKRLVRQNAPWLFSILDAWGSPETPFDHLSGNSHLAPAVLPRRGRITPSVGSFGPLGATTFLAAAVRQVVVAKPASLATRSGRPARRRIELPAPPARRSGPGPP
jgi:hypothetical protein